MSIEEWSKKYKAIGRLEGYSEVQVQEYKLYIDLIKNMNKLRY